MGQYLFSRDCFFLSMTSWEKGVIKCHNGNHRSLRIFSKSTTLGNFYRWLSNYIHGLKEIKVLNSRT